MPITYEDHKELVLADIKELAAKGWTQKAIAERTGYSQQSISRFLAQLREESRTSLRNHYQRLAWHYEMVIENIVAVRRECWATLDKTQDARSKSVLYNTLLSANRELLEVLAAGDLVEQEILNAEVLATQAKKEITSLQRSLESIDSSSDNKGRRSKPPSDSSTMIEGYRPSKGGSELQDFLSTMVLPAADNDRVEKRDSDAKGIGSTYEVLGSISSDSATDSSSTIESSSRDTSSTIDSSKDFVESFNPNLNDNNNNNGKGFLIDDQD